jgi:hypothetical protein
MKGKSIEDLRFVEAVQERDIDLLLLEEVIASAEFRNWRRLADSMLSNLNATTVLMPQSPAEVPVWTILKILFSIGGKVMPKCSKCDGEFPEEELVRCKQCRKAYCEICSELNDDDLCPGCAEMEYDDEEDVGGIEFMDDKVDEGEVYWWCPMLEVNSQPLKMA